MSDALKIGDYTFNSRVMLGTGKYSTLEQMDEALAASGTEVVTVAVRRVKFGEQDGPERHSSGFLQLGRGSKRRCSRARHCGAGRSRARQCGAGAGRVGSPPFFAGHRHLSASSATATSGATAADYRRQQRIWAAGRHGALRGW